MAMGGEALLPPKKRWLQNALIHQERGRCSLDRDGLYQVTRFGSQPYKLVYLRAYNINVNDRRLDAWLVVSCDNTEGKRWVEFEANLTLMEK